MRLKIAATFLGSLLTLGQPIVRGQVPPSASDSLHPVYPAVPPTLRLDEHGDPIFGLDLPIEDLRGGALASFHAALRRAERGEGQARVVVYGASHVASDTWTAALRRGLQARFGDAGHGFVLPIQPWRGYRHADVAIDSTLRLWTTLRYRVGQATAERYGLAGVALESADPTAYGRLDTGTARCSSIEVYFEQQDAGGSFELIVDGTRVERVITTGPRASGYRLVQVPDGRHTVELRPVGDGPVRIYGVSLERTTPGVIVDALGINGARAASQLFWDEALYQEHLRRRMPDLLVLAYGTNESGDDDQPIAEYEATLRQVIERARRTVPLASCLLVGPSDRPIVRRGAASPRPRTLEIIAAQRRAARDFGCGFFDLVAWGGGPMHMLAWATATPAWALRDRIHFTPRAYRRLGEVVSNALLAAY